MTGTLTQTAGGLHLAGGNLTAQNALNIQGGVLDGNGTINGNVSVTAAGQFSPGASPGEISITNNRNYTQATPGVFAADINGTTPGVDYDRLLVAGAATLGGELKVTLGYDRQWTTSSRSCSTLRAREPSPSSPFPLPARDSAGTCPTRRPPRS